MNLWRMTWTLTRHYSNNDSNVYNNARILFSHPLQTGNKILKFSNFNEFFDRSITALLSCRHRLKENSILYTEIQTRARPFCAKNVSFLFPSNEKTQNAIWILLSHNNNQVFQCIIKISTFFVIFFIFIILNKKTD